MASARRKRIRGMKKGRFKEIGKKSWGKGKRRWERGRGTLMEMGVNKWRFYG